MSWPLSQDYNEAIQDPAASFGDPELKRGQPVTNALGLPMPRSGNFADVYEVHCPATGNKWAVKCFTRQVAGQAQRYSEISRHLEQTRLPFGVDFQYQPRGILVRGQWYPILKMRWVEGMLLNDFVREQVNKPVLLHALTQIWLRMSRRLREAGIAHADLQHGNVILVPGSKMQSLAVKLIDYDGMYVPALAGKKSGEVGHANYQHPQRIREGTYSAEVDRFPLLLIATALRALELGGRGLWERYDNGDNLLFKEADLRAPAASPLFAELRQTSDPLLRTLAGRLEQACHLKLESAPRVEELIPEERRKGKTAAEEAAAANVWDFSDPEPARTTRRRRKKRVPAWLWVVGGVSAVILAGGGVYLSTLGGRGGKPQPVAQNNTLPDTSRRPATHPVKPPENDPPDQRKPVERGPAEKQEPPERKGPPDLPRPGGGTEVAAVADPPDVKDPLSRLEPDPVKQPEKPPVATPPQPAAVVYEKPAVYPPRLFRGLGPGDNRLAMTDGGNNWRLMDWKVFKPVRKFVGHTGPVTCLAVTADRQRALTGSEDRTLRLWDLDSGACLGVFPQHARTVVDVAVSADGGKALSADGGPYARLWDVNKAQEQSRLSPERRVSVVALSPDGTRAALAGAADHSVLLYDTDSGRLLRECRGHTDAVTGLAFSPDGAQLASGSKDRTMRFWDVKKDAAPVVKENLFSPVVRVSFCAEGKKVLVEMEQGAWVLASAGHAVLANSNRPPDAAVCYTVDEAGAKLWTNYYQENQSLGRWEANVRAEPVVVKPPPPPPPTPRPRPKPAGPERLPVPEAAAIAAAEKDLREELADDFKKTAMQDRVKLANKLGRFNRPGEEPAKRYAALKEARDVWAEVGILDQAMRQAEQLASVFDVNPIQARWEALDKTVKAGGRFTIRPHPVDQALGLAELARAEENYDLAAKILETARRSANKSGNPTQKLQVVHAEQEVAALRAEQARLKKNLEILAANPDNPEANLAVGRFRCLFKDDWAEGLLLLAKGGDAGLKAAAEKEIQDADTPAACKKIADAWFDQAARFTGPAQAALRRRAALWYWLSHPDPAVPWPAELKEVKARLTSMARATPEAGDPWVACNVSEAAEKSNYYHLDPLRAIMTKHSYKGGVDVTVVARTPKSNIRIAAGDGAVCIFNHEDSGGVALRRPDAAGQGDGRGQRAGSEVPEGKPDVRVPENKFTLLRWRLTLEGQKVWIEGKLVYEVAEKYDLSFSSPVAVGAYTDPIDVRAVIVRSVANPAPAKQAKANP